MAMSMRSRGNRLRPGVRAVYEDLKPMSEWEHEEGADILLFHLPGFVKEQIRIIADSKGMLKVHGERLVAGNKWNRFQEEVVVPEDCNMSEIRAKFERGILRITMPKRLTSNTRNSPQDEDSSTSQEPPKARVTKPTNLPAKPQQLQDELPSKPTLPTNIPRPQEGTSITPPLFPKLDGPNNPKPTNIYEEQSNTLQKQPKTSVTKPTNIQTRPHQLQDELPLKPTLPNDTTKQQVGTSSDPPPLLPKIGVSNVAKPTNLYEELVPKSTISSAPVAPGSLESAQGNTLTQPGIMSGDRSDGKNTNYGKLKDEQHKKIQKDTRRTLIENHRTSETILKENEIKGNTDKYVDALDQQKSGSMKEKNGTSGVEHYKRAMKNYLPRRFDEDRQLLMNMGAAVIVIMALGTYISYSFGLPEQFND